MKQKIPTSPFATRLSGSAKESELRLRSIFQWKKQRPPVVAIILAALLAIGCGGLVGFYAPVPEEMLQQDGMDSQESGWIEDDRGDTTHPAAADNSRENSVVVQNPTQIRISMDVQYYDDLDRVVEIPQLILPDDWTKDTAAVDSINAAMKQLKRKHEETVVSPLTTAGTDCIFYPAETERYLNLVFYCDYIGSSGNDGSIFTYVYDKPENRLVTIAEALEMAGLTEADLLSRLEREYDLQLQAQQGPAPLSAQDAALIGFRIRNDGQPEFYLTVICGDPPGEPEVMDGWQHLFLWSQGSFTHYNCRAEPENLVPLVPPEETMSLDAPLWCQWYFSGGEPEGGFASVIAALNG